MALEYRLPYTADEINEKLAKIDFLATEQYVDEAIAAIDLPTGGGGEWELIEDITLEEDVTELNFTGLSHKDVFVLFNGTVKDIRDETYNNKVTTVRCVVNGTNTTFNLANSVFINKADKYYYLINKVADYCISRHQHVLNISTDTQGSRWSVALADGKNGITKLSFLPNMQDTYNDKYQNCGRFKAGTTIKVWGVKL